MSTRRTELPGVGTKYTIELKTGDEIVVVEHRDGRWEVARVDPQGDVTPALALQPDEGGELGRILSRGQVEHEDSRRQMLFEEFGLEWVTLESNSPLLGQTLLDSGIRPRTGASVIAILRPDGSIPSPPPDTVLRERDTLVLIGHRTQVDRFLRTFTHLTPNA